MGVGNVMDAYLAGRGAVSGVLLMGIATTLDKHPVYGTTLYDEKLSAMRKLFGRYPVQVRHVPVCGKIARGGKHFFVLLACELPLPEPRWRLPRPSLAGIHSRKTGASGQAREAA